MNDCLWCGIGVCDGDCKCDKYLSMNSDKGRELGDKYDELIHETLKPVKFKFAEENGF